MLWLRISGPDSRTVSRAASLPPKSGTSSSIRQEGEAERMARTVAAKCRAPPSARSSRVTEVITAWRSSRR